MFTWTVGLLAGSRAASRGCRRRALRRAQIAGRTGLGDLVDHKFQCGAGAARVEEDGLVDRAILFLEAVVISKDVQRDRKSTRLNSSHTVISYAVFCLK